SPPPSGPARPRCLPSLTTASPSPHRERGPARELGTASRRNRNLDLDIIAPSCRDAFCGPSSEGRVLTTFSWTGHVLSCPVQVNSAVFASFLRLMSRLSR